MAWLVRHGPGRRKIERSETEKSRKEVCGWICRREQEVWRFLNYILMLSRELLWNRYYTFRHMNWSAGQSQYLSFDTLVLAQWLHELKSHGNKYGGCVCDFPCWSGHCCCWMVLGGSWELWRWAKSIDHSHSFIMLAFGKIWTIICLFKYMLRTTSLCQKNKMQRYSFSLLYIPMLQSYRIFIFIKFYLSLHSPTQLDMAKFYSHLKCQISDTFLSLNNEWNVFYYAALNPIVLYPSYDNALL